MPARPLSVVAALAETAAAADPATAAPPPSLAFVTGLVTSWPWPLPNREVTDCSHEFLREDMPCPFDAAFGAPFRLNVDRRVDIGIGAGASNAGTWIADVSVADREGVSAFVVGGCCSDGVTAGEVGRVGEPSGGGEYIDRFGRVNLSRGCVS